MYRFSVKAIVLGMLAMFALDLLSGVVSFMVFGGDALQPGATQEQIQAVAESARQNNGYLLSTLVLGTLTTILGGYITARLAQQLPLFNAGALGVVALGTLFVLGSPGETPWWLDLFGAVSTIPAAIFGGVLGRRARHG
ncbi:MAG: hypothetical protein ABI343_08980 [Burkholderiaceae bacterium]